MQQAGRGKQGLETVEMDPDVARGLGWADGETVRSNLIAVETGLADRGNDILGRDCYHSQSVKGEER